LIGKDVLELCPDGLRTTPALTDLLFDCRQAARHTSDQLNTLFFSHSALAGQIVSA